MRGNPQAAGGAAALVPGVPELVARLTDAWREAGEGRPSLGRTFTRRERSVREKALDGFVRTLGAEAKRPPLTPDGREACRTRIYGAFGRLAREGFNWRERHIDALFGAGFDRVAEEFVRAAGAFDAAVSPTDVFQACRNVWVANGLQKLMGLAVRLTPSITAYSLLYPYTDNYLDDPGVDEATKLAFSGRLRARLEGRPAIPANPMEKAIFELVAVIEGEHDRSLRPQVFESLIAIHEAQGKSLRLLRSDGPASEEDVVAIGLEKGGASVLADGCLVAGALAPAEVEFLFGFGGFLQLMDDLEDVLDDRQAGIRTVFSRLAGREPLDAVTDRTLRFGARVLEGLDVFGSPDAEPLKELIRSSLVQGAASTAGRFGRLYTRPYLRELEAHSPFRFSFYSRQRRKLARRRAALARLFASLSAIAFR